MGQASYDQLSWPLTQIFNFTKIQTNGTLFREPDHGHEVESQTTDYKQAGMRTLPYPRDLCRIRSLISAA